MKLQIISLKGVEFDGEISSLNLKTAAGEITVLDKHRPLMTTLVTGKAHIVKKDGERTTFNISSGFLEVNSHEVNILVN